MECASRAGENLLRQQQAKQQQDAAVAACINRIGNMVGYANALLQCQQNPNLVAQQPQIIAPPAGLVPIETVCRPWGNAVRCESF